MMAILSPISSSEPMFKPIISSMSKSPDRGSVHAVAVKALQTKAVRIERLDGSIFRNYRLQPTSDYFYVLKCRPSSRLRLLSQEEERLQAEALVLQSLRGTSDVLVPRLIEYHTTPTPMGSPYLINGPFKGSILSDIEASLSRHAFSSIDKSLGRYVRQLSHISGPAFGAIRTGTPPTSPSWSRCFAALLESILRDGENALITLPYDFIRDQVRRHRQVLDQITQPKLVLLEMASDQNVLINTNEYTVAGLLDFSTAIWGDPFMSDCFHKPRLGFVEGFGRLPNRDTNERIRQYLYGLYHSLLAVVRHCYRPSGDGDELAARRTLVSSQPVARDVTEMCWCLERSSFRTRLCHVVLEYS
ncbi:hypothetical protein DOTSEDRAFT_74634 [Dothistroma septosporum NZE10]|uniref:Aminoglycoside phosphotransferase domain-containing protein n=1 Tax=Dothistroma septosporum (strain NZE10 / CBS 128990) TaxID=675120 RepID=N1PBU8_DOTSN|nr:hypothetical protein DOTSEDRAFT_74634 [Dothistroma septosporum NZE10]